eukprot:m51a1_g4483 putative glycoside hydrolase family 7 protein (486) ;mRNA; r:275598-277207
MQYRALVCLALAGLAASQQAGTLTSESHPSLTTYECTSSSCSSWASVCSDPDTCATSCALDGADYSGTYGVTASGTSLTLKFVTKGSYSTNIGSRLFLMASESKYQMFKLINREFAFDVDVSQLPCGLNGALYFSEMAEDGGMGVGNNKAGAKYGTGYCDAQCPHDIKFINGQANVLNWTASSTDSNAGTGQWGSCCGEMDIWEANSISTALTPHNCNFKGQKRCESASVCGDTSGGYRYKGVCDKDGCDWNPYRMGDKTFYGPSMTVDTTQSFTVVTQFVTSDGTDDGDLTEIRRYYKQNGKVIPNSYSTYSTLSKYNSISDAMCVAQKSLFGDTDDFTNKGGLTNIGAMLKRGMVLVLSLWDDHDVNMLWLDSNMPATGSASTPGVARGTCSVTSGKPTDVESNSPNAQVIFSNIKFGKIGTTTTGVSTASESNTDSTTVTTKSSSKKTATSTAQESTINPTGSAASLVAGAATLVLAHAIVA